MADTVSRSWFTSIFSPEDIYRSMVSRENQDKDTIKGL